MEVHCLTIFVVFVALAGYTTSQNVNQVVKVGDSMTGGCVAPATHVIETKINNLKTTFSATSFSVPHSVPATATDLTDAVSVTCLDSTVSVISSAFDIIVVNDMTCPTPSTVSVAVGDEHVLVCKLPYRGAVIPQLKWTKDGVGATETITVLNGPDYIQSELVLEPNAAGGPFNYKCAAVMPTTWPTETTSNNPSPASMPASILPCDTTVTFTPAAVVTPASAECPTIASVPGSGTVVQPVPVPATTTTSTSTTRTTAPTSPTPTTTLSGVTPPSCPTTTGYNSGKTCTSAVIAVGCFGGLVALIGLYWAFLRNPVQPVPMFTQPESAFTQPGSMFAQPELAFARRDMVYVRPVYEPMRYMKRPSRFIRRRNFLTRRALKSYF